MKPFLSLLLITLIPYFISAQTSMVKVAGGLNTPFLETQDTKIDIAPVTNQEFVDFVNQKHYLRRTNILRLYTNKIYQQEWLTDSTLNTHQIANFTHRFFKFQPYSLIK